MPQSRMARKQERLDAMFGECRELVFSQIIGPFGLSPAMFKDRAGGNVTTFHNFEQGIVANDNDQILFDSLSKPYDRKDFNDPEWKDKREAKIKPGVDDHTGKKLSDKPELDHVEPVDKIARKPKVRLAFGEVQADGTVSLRKAAPMVNGDHNLAITDMTINRSKKAEDALEWANKPSTSDPTKTNAELQDINKDVLAKRQREARAVIEKETGEQLWDKQKAELIETSKSQALRMGLRQGLGILLVELVNGLFHEVKAMIEKGFELSKALIAEIGERLARVLKSTLAKIPDAIGAVLAGGATGILSNLVTFAINIAITTGQRLVRIIREGLFDMLRAFKTMAFPDKGVSQRDAVKAGVKMLATAVATALGVLAEQGISTFMASVPLLAPVADLVPPVLIGIATGLAAAFVGYLIDMMFDRYSGDHEEARLDEMMADAKRMDEFANGLADLAGTSLRNIQNYNVSLALCMEISNSYEAASNDAATTLQSLEATNAADRLQIERSAAAVASIEASQAEIEEFLKGRA